MNYRHRAVYCYNCSKSFPKAAVRCPWCASGRVSHVPRPPAYPGDLVSQFDGQRSHLFPRA